MPPRAAPGVRRPGRGRGKASAVNEPEVAESFTTSSDTQPIHGITAVPQGNTDLSSSNLATGTGNSTTRAPRESATAGSSRGGRGLSRNIAAAAPSASRFKPKNVRRSATELAEIAQKEQIKQADIAAELARQQARLLRGRGRARGRGDAMGRGRGAPGAASSIFGVVPESLKKASGVLSMRSGGGSGGTGFGGSSNNGAIGRFSVKNEGTGYAGGGGGGGGGGGYRNGHTYITPQYPGEDENVERIDIEHINLISDDEGDLTFTGSQQLTDKSKFSTKNRLKPVRLHREEHKKRATIVNTASKEPSQDVSTSRSKASLDSDDESLFVSDNRRSNEDPMSASFPKTVIKTDPTDESSDLKVKVEPDMSETPTNYLPENSPGLSPKTESNLYQETRQLIEKHHVKPVMQTEEDRAEYERHIEDLTILVNELGGLQGKLTPKSQDLDGDTSMEDSTNPTIEQDKKDGRLYLFQFPPVLPILYNPLTEEKPGSNPEKEKNGAANMDQKTGDFNAKGKGKAVDGPSTVKLEDTSTVKLEGTSTVKLEDDPLEDGVEILDDRKEDITGRREVVNEEGFIGKLVVRESGRVELCWGGTRLLVGRGIDASFLTTGVVVDGIERGPLGGGVPEGKAFGMGQIMGKFVVTPDWMSMMEA
ncbi:hypothetical protein K3495_g5954 [Podosphaera aphanis]|nr:hypothetical protein K3495_g5954 [Podosphaera aphanis]